MTQRDLSLPALVVTVLAWASAFVGIRAVSDTFSPGALTLGRLLVALLALLVIVRPRLTSVPRGRDAWLTLLYGAAWFGVYNVALNAAERDLDAGTTALIVNIGPILIAVLAGWFLREGFPRPLLVGMGIAFAGVVLIAVSTRADSSAVSTATTLGVVLCVVAAVCYAIGAVAQKPTLAVVPPSTSVWFGCLIGALLCLPFGPTLVSELGDATPTDVGWVVFLGVVPSAIGFTTWAYAIKRLSAGQVASSTYLVPLTTTLMSWVVLDEIPATLAFVGGALCLVGVAVTRLRPRSRTQQRADAGDVGTVGVEDLGDQVVDDGR